MKAFNSIITTFGSVIVASDILRRIYFKGLNPLMVDWILWGLFIFVYSGIVIMNKKIVKPIYNFWQTDYTPFSKALFIDTYREYAQRVDARYFNQHNFVYLIESTNVIISLLLVYALIKRKMNLIMQLLFVQMVCCMIFFISAEKILFYDLQSNIYLLISAIWIIIPMILLVN